jgi:hypothetical protein
MNDLLAFAIEAHGGMERWNSFTSLAAEVSIDGAIWHLKQQAGLLADKVFDIDTHNQHVIITPFMRDDLRSVFAPGLLTLESGDGTVEESRESPEASFSGQTADSPWDKFHVAYFASEALWTYLTSPFLYTYPGFETEEIDPWQEDGEEWRRLRVTFPDYIKSHTKTQVTHFGSDGLVRRHDYTVDILGGTPGANYPTGYREFQGLMMPTKRRIFAYDEAGRKVAEPILVSLDFGRLTFS